MLELIHVTAAYSNAVLVAVLPHVSDFAKRLDLPIPQPITASQVAWFKPLPIRGQIGGALQLTNHYWFHFSQHGYICNFRSPKDWFSEQEPAANVVRYLGKTSITTKEAVQLARETLRSLGISRNSSTPTARPEKSKAPTKLTREPSHSVESGGKGRRAKLLPRTDSATRRASPLTWQQEQSLSSPSRERIAGVPRPQSASSRNSKRITKGG